MGILCWLNQNIGAVTAAAAVGGVVVASVYTFLTLLLWRQTRRQAASTEAALEIGHRPFVAVAVALGPGGNPRRIPITLQLRNHGEGPAIVERWMLTIRLGENAVAERDTAGDNTTLVLFPGEEQETVPLSVEGQKAVDTWASREPIRIEAVVHYRGALGKPYMTRMRARLGRPGGVPPQAAVIATEDQEIT